MTSDSYLISIVILNWNTSDLLIQLVNSIKKHTFFTHEIIVFDNGSKQEELEKIRSLENVQLFENKENIGFAAGNNAAYKLINARFLDFVFFINSDIEIFEDKWDLKMIDCLSHVDIGIVGCAYHPLTWDKNGNFHIQPIPQKQVESQSVQGAFFGLKKKTILDLFKKDGFLFDENFKYAQYEETDLCFRARKLGYKVMWVPIKHEHYHNKSATKSNGYCLNKEIKNINDFKANAERNKRLLIQKHRDIL